MEHYILVHPVQDRFLARSLVLTDVTAEAKTEDEAYEAVRQALAEQFPADEFVRVGPYSMRGTGNPWLDYFGYARDDLHFQEYLDEIQRARDAADQP